MRCSGTQSCVLQQQKDSYLGKCGSPSSVHCIARAWEAGCTAAALAETEKTELQMRQRHLGDVRKTVPAQGSDCSCSAGHPSDLLSSTDLSSQLPVTRRIAEVQGQRGENASIPCVGAAVRWGVGRWPRSRGLCSRWSLKGCTHPRNVLCCVQDRLPTWQQGPWLQLTDPQEAGVGSGLC